MEEKDNPALVFSGETKDWPSFKDAIQMRADKHDTTWLFEGGRSLAEFFARQIKEKTGTKTTRAKALEREVAKDDSNHVPTSVCVCLLLQYLKLIGRCVHRCHSL